MPHLTHPHRRPFCQTPLVVTQWCVYEMAFFCWLHMGGKPGDDITEAQLRELEKKLLIFSLDWVQSPL